MNNIIYGPLKKLEFLMKNVQIRNKMVPVQRIVLPFQLNQFVFLKTQDHTVII